MLPNDYNGFALQTIGIIKLGPFQMERLMGQAKQRGTFEQRQQEAIAAQRNQFPESVTCNNCEADLVDIQPLDVRGLTGMRLAGVAHCEACSHETWVLDGTPEALGTFQSFLDSEHGADAVAMGIARRASDS